MSIAVGKMIAAERIKKGLSREQLAERAKIATETLARYERGDRNPKPQIIERLASVLDVTTDYLMGREENKNRPASTKADEAASTVKLLKDQILVPVYINIVPHCGPGNNNEGVVGEIDCYLPFSAADLGTHDVNKVFGVQVEGSSMASAKIPDGSIAIIRACNGDWEPRYGDPCYVQYLHKGFMLDAIKFYYPSKDGKFARIASAEGSGIAPLDFDEEELKAGYLIIKGVVISVVESHKPTKGI